MSKVRHFSSFFDWIRFFRYLANIEQIKQKKIRTKHFNTINWLRRQRFGSSNSSGKTICNLSSYNLSETEKFVLAYGLEFCLPPTNIKREEVFAEFEILFAQLLHPKPKSIDELSLLKAKLNKLAHSFCGSLIYVTKFPFDSDSLQTIESPRSNKHILITKPDKGSGVVILNRSEYDKKMVAILSDVTTCKFECLRPVNQFDNTVQNETKLQRRLLQLVKSDDLPKTVYEVIRSTGSQRPRMYGLPKIHKQAAPCRPILSMIGSAQHELAKFLAAFLQPVLELYSTNCINDSFSFAEMIQQLKVNSNDSILCSFDICSLFTNVTLAETIEIKTLYDDHLPTPVIPKYVFIKLMKTATTSVEFSFNNIMYRQIDGIAMGSPLGPALANIFVGYYESKLFNKISKPTVYCRYVDDTFSLFHKETEFQKFLNCLNSLHPSLKFTNEIKTNNSLPFLDVLVTKSNNKFITSVYRKPTFTDQYIHWNSFGLKQRKTNLIDTLTHRALKICSKSTLKHELEKHALFL